MNKRGHRVQTQPLIPDVQNLIQKYRQFNLIPNRISVPIANASHHVYSYSPPVPPVPPAPWRRAEPKLPNIVELRPHRSRRSAFDANNIASLIGVLAMLFIMGVVFTLFVNQWWEDIKPKKVPNALPIVAPDEPIDVPKGAGKSLPPKRVQAEVAAPLNVNKEAFQHLKRAVENCRKENFVEADSDAQKALKINPRFEEAKTVRILIGYAKQYPQLAESAENALNGNCEVDLGSKYGKALFIEKDDQSVTFRTKGQNKRFSRKELQGIPGVHFRITQQFLANANNPANDLILGAFQFLRHVDENGNDLPAGIDSTPSHWKKATKSQEEEFREHAELLIKLSMMKLLD